MPKAFLILFLSICLIECHLNKQIIQKTLSLVLKYHNIDVETKTLNCINNDQSNIIILQGINLINQSNDISYMQFFNKILKKINGKTQKCLRNNFMLNKFLQKQGHKNIKQTIIKMKKYIPQQQEQEKQKQIDKKLNKNYHKNYFQVQSQVQTIKIFQKHINDQNNLLENRLENNRVLQQQTQKSQPQQPQCADVQGVAWAQVYFSQLNRLKKQHPQLSYVQQKLDYYNSKFKSQQTLQPDPYSHNHYVLAQPQKQKQKYKPQYHFLPVPITPQQIKFAMQLRTLVQNPNNPQLCSKEYKLYEEKYQISQYDELPFCVFISSYNNMKNQVYKRNLISVLQQNYTNYHVIYIEDASPDGTYNGVYQFLKNHPLRHKVQLVRNQINIANPANFIKAANNYCKPNDIFFRVDGDDQMIGRQSLKIFNSIYQKHDSWVTYAACIQEACLGKPKINLSNGYNVDVAENNDFRYQHAYPFFGQLSFYNQLLLNVNVNDLKSKRTGEFYKQAGDSAVGWPILEMAGKSRISYIPQVLYYYNLLIGDHDTVNMTKVRNQAQYLVQLKYRPKYPIINQLFLPEQKPTKMKIFNTPSANIQVKNNV